MPTQAAQWPPRGAPRAAPNLTSASTRRPPSPGQSDHAVPRVWRCPRQHRLACSAYRAACRPPASTLPLGLFTPFCPRWQLLRTHPGIPRPWTGRRWRAGRAPRSARRQAEERRARRPARQAAWCAAAATAALPACTPAPYCSPHLRARSQPSVCHGRQIFPAEGCLPSSTLVRSSLVLVAVA